MHFYKKLLKFVDKPFKLGGNDKNGYDCLGVVGRIQEELGKQFPHSFGDIDEFNYGELYMKDRPAAEEKMIEFIDSFATPVDIKRILPGDILVIESKKNGYKFPAVYLGNLNYITSFSDIGVKVFTLDNEKINLLKAWRL